MTRLRDRLPPDMRATAALILATAGVLGIFLANWVAGAIAMILLAAGTAVLIRRGRLPGSPERHERSPGDDDDDSHA